MMEWLLHFVESLLYGLPASIICSYISAKWGTQIVQWVETKFKKIA
jgi:hypothetical protein